MKKPKVPEINMPYASTVASFFGDQGAVQGNSFLGRLFRGGGRAVVSQNQAPPAGASAPRVSNNLARSDRGGSNR